MANINRSSYLITLLVLLSIAMVPLQCKSSTVKVYYTTTIRGEKAYEAFASTEGGAMLYILGKGFSTTGTTVKIGENHECAMSQGSYISTKVIVCKTPKIPAGIHKITVEVSKGSLTQISTCYKAGKCLLHTGNDYTPYINQIDQLTQYPMSDLSFKGKFTMESGKDVAFTIGDGQRYMKCKTAGQTIGEDFSEYSPKEFESQTCAIPEMRVGYYQFDAIANTKGNSDIYHSYSRNQYGVHGKRVNLLISPQITSIKESNERYSPNGQQFLIKGQGFSSFKERVQVTVGEQECVVLKTNYEAIICDLPPVQQPVPGDVAFVGGRGYKKLFWKTQENNEFKSSDATITHHTDLKQLNSNGKLKSQGLFKAPANGIYKFLLESDSSSEFLLSEIKFDTMILDYEFDLESLIKTKSSINGVYQKSSISKGIELEKDSYYYYEVHHNATSKNDRLTVGVEIPNNDPSLMPINNAYDVSELEISYTPILESFSIDTWNYEEKDKFHLTQKSCVDGDFKYSKAISAGADCADVVKRMAEFGVEGTCVREEIDSNGSLMCEKEEDINDFDFDFGAFDFGDTDADQENEDSWDSDTTDFGDFGDWGSPEDEEETTPVEDTEEQCFNPDFVGAGYKYTFTVTEYRECKEVPRFLPVSPFEPPACKTCKLYNGEKAIKVLEIGSVGLLGTVQYNVNEEILEVDFDESEETLLQKIKDLKSIQSSEIQIQREGYCSYGCKWIISFIGEKLPIDISLRSNRLSFDKMQTPSLLIKKLQESSSNYLYMPITSEFLFTLESYPQLKVSIVSPSEYWIPAACTSLDCDYDVDLNYAPLVEVYSFDNTENILTVQISSTQIWTQKEIEIRFLESQCDITAFTPLKEIIDDEELVTSYEIQCKLLQVVFPAGDHLPSIKLENSGFIPLSENLVATTINAQLFSVLPQTGSSAGGQKITITGEHLGQFDEMYMNTQIFIGGKECQITEQNQEIIECITPQGMTLDSTITLSVNGLDFTDNSYTFVEQSAMPVLSSYTPLTANPVIKNQLTITGMNFGTVNKVTVFLISPEATSKNIQCFVSSITETEIVCMTNGGYTGEYKLQIHEEEFGYYENNLSDFKFEILVQGISPATGSKAGGNIITIQGNGFSKILQQNQVMFDTKFCKIITATPTEITCITPPWSGLDIMTIDVLTKITEKAECINCLFAYTDEATPKITSILRKEQVGILFNPVVTNGEVIILEGELLLDPTDTTLTQLFDEFDRLTAKLNEETIVLEKIDGKIAFTMPALPSGEYELSVVHETFGGAIGAQGRIVLETPLVFSSMSPKTGSLAGTILTLTGNGFDIDQEIDIFLGNDNECSIISKSTTEITCLTQKFAKEPKLSSEVKIVTKKQELTCDECTFMPKTDLTSSVISNSVTRSEIDGSISAIISGEFIIPARRVLVEDTLTEVYLANNQNFYEATKIYTANVDTITDTEITAQFEGVVAGDYYIFVNIADQGFAGTESIQDSFMTAELIIDETLPETVISSYAGGQEVTFTGFGFDDSIVGTIHGRQMEIISSSFNSITFITPVYVTEGSDPEFKLSSIGPITEQIQVQLIGDSEIGLKNLIDDDIFTHYESDSQECYVGFNFGEGQIIEIHEVHYLFKEKAIIEDYVGFLIQKSDDGETWTEISTEEDIRLEDWNIFEGDDANLHMTQYLRLYAPNTQCHFSEIEVIGKALLRNDHPQGIFGISAGASKWETTQEIISYDETKTAVITSLLPERGSTAGGTELILSGKNFREQYCENQSVLIEDCETILSYCESSCSDISVLTESECATSGSCQEPGVCQEDQSLGQSQCNQNSYTWKDEITYTTQEECDAKSLTFTSNSWKDGFAYSTEAECLNQNLVWVIEGHQIITPIEILVDEIQCVISLITLTEIRCTTGPRPNFVQSSLKVTQIGDGYVATKDHIFTYIDLWSESSTWGGESPPREGDSVYIPPGQNILMDVKTPNLYAVIIEKSTLIFDHTQDVSMDAELIFIKQGHLVIGSDTQPICKSAIVTLHGNWQSRQLPIYGQKGIFVREGSLNIHGCPKQVTWTSLDTTANTGEDFIILEEIADWNIGDVIAITSTDYNMDHVETKTISQIEILSAKSKITLDSPLKYDHFAGDIKLNAFQDQRITCEVGLLTRNVVIQGDEQSDALEYGAHVIISGSGDESATGRIQYAEFRRVGQAASTGRYPINFQMIGKIKTSIVKGNSIQDSHNRAISIQGCHYLKVEDNVVYNIKGHAFFLSDGSETKNSFSNNLAINTRSTYGMLATDQMPAAFWISNPNNIFIGNHVAGSDHCGFWYSLDVYPEGMSAADNICPRGTQMGSFRENVAHSTWRYGLRIYKEFTPRRFPCQARDSIKNPGVEAVFQDFLAFKNQQNGVIAETLGKVTFRNITSIDNGHSEIEISVADSSNDFQSKIVDSIVVGTTTELHESIDSKAHQGIITPRTEGFLVDGVQFVNYNLYDETRPELEVVSHGSCSNPSIKDKEICELSGECQGDSCSDNTVITQEDCEITEGNTWTDVSLLENSECAAGGHTWVQYTWNGVGQDFFAIGTCSHCNLPGGQDSGARTVSFNRLTFENTGSFILYGGPRRAILKDMDGSLTGQSTSGWATPYFKHNDVPGCTQNDLYSGLVCDNTITLRRVAFTGLSGEINGNVIKLLRLDEGVDLENAVDLDYSILSYTDGRDPPRAWAIPVVLGHNFNIHWSSVEINWKDITIMPSVHNYLPNDDSINFRFNYTAMRELFEVEYYAQGLSGKQLFPYNHETPLDSTSLSGDFFVDTENKHFNIRIDGSRMGKFIVKSVICRETCPPKPKKTGGSTTSSGTTEEPWSFSMEDEDVGGKLRYWSDPSWWKVPVDGDDVHIDASWRVVVDVEQTAMMKNLEVSGHLIIPVVNITYPMTHINAEQMWFNRNGKIVVGTNMVLLDQAQEDTNVNFRRFNKYGLHLNCQGNQSENTFVISPTTEVLYNVIATTVNFVLKGRKTYTDNTDGTRTSNIDTQTFLYSSAKIGDTVIWVAKSNGWQIGDRLLITTSQMNAKAFDEVTITKIEGKKVTITAGLKFSHKGGQNMDSYKWGKVDGRSRVALLNRNVVVECRIQPFKYFNEYTFDDNTGMIYLDNIEMKNCGTTSTNKGCINLESINDNQMHIVLNSAIHDGKAKAVVAYSSSQLFFNNNVFHSFISKGVDFNTVSQLTFANNLVSNVKGTGLFYSGTPAITSYGNSKWGIRISDNFVVGSSFANYILTPGPCQKIYLGEGRNLDEEDNVDPKDDKLEAADLDYSFVRNTAISGAYGIMTAAWGRECTRLHHFNAVKSSATAVSSIWAGSHLRLDHLVLQDNKIGVQAMVQVENQETPFFRMTRSSIIGLSCIDDNSCGRLSANECSNMHGIIHPNSQESANFFPRHFRFPLTQTRASPSFNEGVTSIRNSEFKNYQELTDIPNANFKCLQNTAYEANINNPDLAPLMNFRRITLSNVPFENFAQFYDPQAKWLEYKHFNCLNVNCYNPKNVILRILDDSIITGGLLGMGSTLISNNPGIIDSQCKRVEQWNGYHCEKTEYTNVLFEILDANRNKKVQRPITFMNGPTNFTNVISPMMDKSDSSYDISGQRFPRFSAAVRKNLHYFVDFVGHRPQEWKWQLQYSNSLDYVVIVVDYVQPNSLEVTAKGKLVDPIVVSSKSIANYEEEILAGGFFCGKHIFVYQDTKIYFILTGEDDCIIHIKQIDAVRLTLKIEMPIQDFYDNDGAMTFIDKMTTFLGIPRNKLKIVSIIQGSVIIDYEVILDDTTKNSEVFKKVVDTQEKNLTKSQLQQTCDGVTKGIAKAIQDGVLDFGAPVSKLNYQCTEIVDSDEKFEEKTINGGETPTEVITGEVKFDDAGKGYGELKVTEEVLAKSEEKMSVQDIVYRVVGAGTILTVIYFSFSHFSKKQKIKKIRKQKEQKSKGKKKNVSLKMDIFNGNLQTQDSQKGFGEIETSRHKDIAISMDSPVTNRSNEALIKEQTHELKVFPEEKDLDFEIDVCNVQEEI